MWATAPKLYEYIIMFFKNSTASIFDIKKKNNKKYRPLEDQQYKYTVCMMVVIT